MAHACQYPAGREAYAPAAIVYENLVIAGQIGCGAALMTGWRIIGVPVLSVLFLAWCAVMLGYVLRRQLCSRCYYYGKWCHCGWGKLAAVVVKKAADPTPTQSKLAPIFWLTTMALPVVVVGAALVASRTTWRVELPYAIGFAVSVALSGIMHVRDCRFCRMRCICPGSAARGQSV